MRLSFFKNTFFLVKLGFNELKGSVNLKPFAELTPFFYGVSTSKLVFLMKFGILFFIIPCFSCGSQNKETNATTSEEIVIHDTVRVGSTTSTDTKDIVIGAERFSAYFPLLKGKNIGLVANHTSVVHFAETIYPPNGEAISVEKEQHLVDLLLDNNFLLKKVFSPEHGFRGTADAGEFVKNGLDTKTDLPIISLYGKNKELHAEMLQGIDMMVFDIQDVGVRFYTYISTLHYVMEACAEANIPLVILDRPNPNGHYIDGPVLDIKYKSFLGMHPVPLVHGMTVGEFAQMINGQRWLRHGGQCTLHIIELLHYTHQTPYSVPVRPSPNLPNDVAINLYPSLGLLEGTNLNAGRGTEMQFQLIGSPYLPQDKYPFSYTPQPNFGSKSPKFNGVLCNGLDLRETPRMSRVDLTWIMDAYRNYEKKEAFFNTKNFTTHAGTEVLQQQIEQGYTFREIRATWLPDLKAYDQMREKYLLYQR